MRSSVVDLTPIPYPDSDPDTPCPARNFSSGEEKNMDCTSAIFHFSLIVVRRVGEAKKKAFFMQSLVVPIGPTRQVGAHLRAEPFLGRSSPNQDPRSSLLHAMGRNRKYAKC